MKQFGHWRAEQLAVMLEGGCGGQLRLLPKPLLGLGAQVPLWPVTAKGDMGSQYDSFSQRQHCFKSLVLIWLSLSHCGSSIKKQFMNLSRLLLPDFHLVQAAKIFFLVQILTTLVSQHTQEGHVGRTKRLIFKLQHSENQETYVEN